jgi:glutathione S-transferase
MLQIHGVPFSVHTRKVIWAARTKELPYEIVPVVPLKPPPGWAELSPLGKIPVLRTGTLDVADSSVICQYLERIHPSPSLYPAEASAFARALWLEEFVDGGLAPHVLTGLLLQRVFAPRFLGRAPDETLIRRSLEQEIPPKLAYLESVLDGDFIVGSTLTIADLTVASMLLNFTYAGERLAAYPKLERYLRARLRDPKMKPAFAMELEAARPIEGLDLALLREALA